MVKIEPFAVEQWMDQYETTPGVLNIAETCAASVSLDDLMAFDNRPASDKTNPLTELASRKLTYGAIPGSVGLRQNIASLYRSGLEADNVVVTQGAIGANHLLLYTLVGPGDHVVCVYPTYQQLYGIPKSLGADVTLWRLQEEQGYIPDVSELESLVRENTKLIIVNNSNNPTGIPIPRAVLEKIIAFTRSRNLYVLGDEVYLPLYHSGTADEPPPSVLDLGYDRAVATGSMSKAFALAGLRIGWIATRDSALRRQLLAARDYTTISVSQLDDAVARYALSADVRPALLRRNIALARTNLALLRTHVDQWVAQKKARWTVPSAGTTAFVQFLSTKDAKPVDDVAFCLDVLNTTKVMMVPGSQCFGDGHDFPGYVRIGYVSETDVLQQGLELLDKYVEEHL